MARLSETTASLRFMGDDLVPDEVTARLGHAPTRAWAKGKRIGTRSDGRPNLALRGIWLLEAGPCRPGNLDDQIIGLLDLLTPDLSVWQHLTSGLRGDVFCGLSMKRTNEGDLLSPRILSALGNRGLHLSLDIYAPLEPDEEAP